MQVHSILSVRRESCKVVLDQMEYAVDLNSPSALRHIVKQLPPYLQSKWAENIDRLGLCFLWLRGSHLAEECTTGIRCKILVCGGRHHPLVQAIARRPLEGTVMTFKGHDKFTKLQNDFVSLSIISVERKSADREIISYALLDNGSGTTFINSDALARLSVKQRSESFAKISVSENAKISLVSGAFQASPVDALQSVKIKVAAAVRELPIMRLNQKVPDKFRHWPHLAKIPVEEVERRVWF